MISLYLIGQEIETLPDFLGIWEEIHNPNFNYGKLTIIKSRGGLNSYKIRVKGWVEKNEVGIRKIKHKNSNLKVSCYNFANMNHYGSI